MPKNKDILVIVGVIGAVLFLVFSAMPKKQARVDAKAAKAAKAAPAPVAAVAGKTEVIGLPDKQEILALLADRNSGSKNVPQVSWGPKDPFDTSTIIPIVQEKAVVSEMEVLQDNAVVLGGVLWNIPKPSAVINGTVLGIGGKIGPWTILEIRAGAVVLTNDQKTVLLKLPQ